MSAINRKQLIGLGIALVIVLLLVVAFVAPSGHEVHSPGGTSVTAAAYPSTDQLAWEPSGPSQSLGDMKCRDFAGGRSPCTREQIASAFPQLAQSDHTLYYVWSGCIDWSGAGAVIPWEGHNIEYFESSRTLLVHCYIGTAYVYRPETFFGVAGEFAGTLLAIPTSGIGSGSLQIREDDRLEHLVGDQSTEYDLATATIT